MQNKVSETTEYDKKNSSASFIAIPVHLLGFGYTKFH